MEWSLQQLEIVVDQCIFFLLSLDSLIPGALVFILPHFRATTVLCKAILEHGVQVAMKLKSSMNARSTGINFLVDSEYRGSPAWLTYSKIILITARNKITNMVHPANIHFPYRYQSDATPLAHVLPPMSILILNHHTFSIQKESTCWELTHMH